MIEHHPEEMKEQHANILMSLSSTYHCLGDSSLGSRYARLHFKQRLLNEGSKSPETKDLALTAMA